MEEKVLSIPPVVEQMLKTSMGLKCHGVIFWRRQLFLIEFRQQEQGYQ